MASTLPTNPTLRRIIHIVGIICGLVAGPILIIHGAVASKNPIEIMWGVVLLAGAIVVTIAGARAEPRGSISPPTVGAKYTYVPDAAWWICAALLVVGIVLTFVLR